MQAFIQYGRQFSMPITQLSGIANMIQLTIVSAERVFELLDEPEETPDAANATTIAAPRGAVQFDDVSFRYKEDVPLIDDMTIDIAPGQNGRDRRANRRRQDDAGEPADAVLRRRQRRDSRGRRGHPRAEARRAAPHVRHGAAGHLAVLRHDSREHRLRARERERRRDRQGGPKAAQADHFIRTLPENYDTPINEEASNLSQGQKQLLTIARAFLADPAILILDEATSSVDTRTEVLIQRAMAELMRGRTTFVIAHRLSTIRNADVILMMEHGRIVEQGTHHELLAAKGRYAELYHSQFAGRAQTVSLVS